MVGTPLPATGKPGVLDRFRTLSVYQTPQPTGGWLRALEPNAPYSRRSRRGRRLLPWDRQGSRLLRWRNQTPGRAVTPQQATVGSRKRPEPRTARSKRPGPRSSAPQALFLGTPGDLSMGLGTARGQARAWRQGRWQGLAGTQPSIGPGIPALWVLLHFGASPWDPRFPPPAHAGSPLPPEAGVAMAGGGGGL